MIRSDIITLSDLIILSVIQSIRLKGLEEVIFCITYASKNHNENIITPFFNWNKNDVLKETLVTLL